MRGLTAPTDHLQRRFGVTVLVLLLFVAVTGLRWVVAPSSGQAAGAPQSNAVVMFVGGRGERLATALDLMRERAATVLVIPNGSVNGWPDANALCSDPQPFEVLCPNPNPDTTLGEAHAIAALADELGWESMVMVTSRYHVSRARLLLERCFEGEIFAVGAETDLSFSEWSARAAHEWWANLGAHTLHRGCSDPDDDTDSGST